MFQKKSLGQNFLKSKKVIADIVRAGNILAGETVLEAGPGEGILTAALLEAGAKVVAVEKDQRLIPFLQQRFSNEISIGKLIIIHADILNYELGIMNHEYKVVANIPYYITGAFIRKFLESGNRPFRMVLLLQKEVVERIVAKDGKESVLSISVKAYGEPRYIETVKAGNFSPAPKVDSAILAIENISKQFFAGFSEERFFNLVKTGFAHKRKMLTGNLKKLDNDIENALISLNISPNARAEDLSLNEWRKIVLES